MSLFFQRATATTAEEAIGRATMNRTGTTVTPQTAMRHSAVWACRRLRADLVSTMPVDVYRTLPDGRKVQMTTPPVLITPDGRADVTEWLYSSQMDLDGFGNAFGIITQKDSTGLPRRIELQPVEQCSVIGQGANVAGYRIGGTLYGPDEVWHERQFTVSGLSVGMSPLAYAAFSIGSYLGAQEFALDWFRSPIPAATLKNTAKIISPDEAASIKARYKSTVLNRDVFVHGSDWEYSMVGVKASESEFINTMKFGIADVCRFLGVPGDMIDAEGSSGSITYANVTQRNLQLLIMNLQPAITRRERALSMLLPQPRFVKLNTDALLRMDPLTRAQLNETLIKSRQRTPDEVREKDDLPPLTDEQVKKFSELFPPKASESVPGPEVVVTP